MNESEDRVKKVIKILLEATGFVTIETFMNELNVSRRTIFNWISATNDELVSHKLDEIENISKIGYRLTSRDRVVINEKRELRQPTSQDEILTAEDRQDEILTLLIDGSNQISINKLADKFGCSRNTIINDFKSLRDQLPTDSILNTSKGKELKLTETQIRIVVLVRLQAESTILKKWIQKFHKSETTKKWVEEMQDECEIRLTENSAIILEEFLEFTFLRIFNQHLILTTQINNEDFGYISNLAVWFEKLLVGLKLELPKEIFHAEAVFIAKIATCLPATKAGNISNKSSLYKDIFNLTSSMINKYEQLTEEQIDSHNFSDMLTNHLFSTYFRVKFRIPFESKEIEQIKKQYPKLIRFTAIASGPFEDYLQEKLPANEIALICLYFGSAEKKDNDFSGEPWKDTNSKIKNAGAADVLIVCSSGIGTSVMLLHQLVAMFPAIKFSQPLEINDLSKVFSRQYVARTIVTTVPISLTKFQIPVVQVKPVLTSSDYEHVETVLKHELPRLFINNQKSIDMLINIVKRYTQIEDENKLRIALNDYLYPFQATQKQPEINYPTLHELLPENHIIQMNETKEWRRVIRVGCQILKKENLILDSYSDGIINLIEKYGPYMLVGKHIMLAHAAPEAGAIKVGLSVVLLAKPLEIEVKNQKEKVSIVFVLSPGKHHEQDLLLEQLIDLVRDDEKLDKLLKSKTITDFKINLLGE